MMKVQRREHILFWLMRPEDSSRWEARGMGGCLCGQEEKGGIRSITKFFVWYTMAIVFAILLSRFH